jgi:hypothetical protein
LKSHALEEKANRFFRRCKYSPKIPRDASSFRLFRVECLLIYVRFAVCTSLVVAESCSRSFQPSSKFVGPDMTKIPVLGWGCFQLKGETAKASLQSALQAGFRLIDTATCYRNEADIGLALRDSEASMGIRRQDVFITSKIAPG